MSVKGRGDRDGDGILWYLALLDEREHWGICLQDGLGHLPARCLADRLASVRRLS